MPGLCGDSGTAVRRERQLTFAYILIFSGVVLSFPVSGRNDHERLALSLASLVAILSGVLFHPGSRGDSRIPVGWQRGLVSGMIEDLSPRSPRQWGSFALRIAASASSAALLFGRSGGGKQHLFFTTIAGGCGILPYAIERSWARSRGSNLTRVDVFSAEEQRHYDLALLVNVFMGCLLNAGTTAFQLSLGNLIWRANGELPRATILNWLLLYPLQDHAASLTSSLALSAFSSVIHTETSATNALARLGLLLVQAPFFGLRYLGRIPLAELGIHWGLDVIGQLFTQRPWQRPETAFPLGFSAVRPLAINGGIHGGIYGGINAAIERASNSAAPEISISAIIPNRFYGPPSPHSNPESSVSAIQEEDFKQLPGPYSPTTMFNSPLGRSNDALAVIHMSARTSTLLGLGRSTPRHIHISFSEQSASSNDRDSLPSRL